MQKRTGKALIVGGVLVLGMATGYAFLTSPGCALTSADSTPEDKIAEARTALQVAALAVELADLSDEEYRQAQQTLAGVANLIDQYEADPEGFDQRDFIQAGLAEVTAIVAESRGE